jgi:dienelactone hydrolase
MLRRPWAAFLAVLVLAGAAAAGETTTNVVKGVVQPLQRRDEQSLPEIYRLKGESFPFEIETLPGGNGLIHAKVRFPSPVETEHPENNTVHAELFRPVGKGPYGCIIVLHIAGGDFPLARFMASSSAYRGVAALFVKLPYYGERRPAGGKTRMLSNNVQRSLTSMRQAVLDLRRACDWMAAQPELDGERLGVMGVSLGAIVGGLASAIEPRLNRACLVMGGARLEHILFDSVERDAKKYRAAWLSAGGTRESFIEMIRPYDAATYADRLCRRKVLMINAARDEVIPRPSIEALWSAAGKQQNIWYPCGHYGMAFYLLAADSNSAEFFREWREPPAVAMPSPK